MPNDSNVDKVNNEDLGQKIDFYINNIVLPYENTLQAQAVNEEEEANYLEHHDQLLFSSLVIM